MQFGVIGWANFSGRFPQRNNNIQYPRCLLRRGDGCSWTHTRTHMRDAFLSPRAEGEGGLLPRPPPIFFSSYVVAFMSREITGSRLLVCRTCLMLCYPAVPFHLYPRTFRTWATSLDLLMLLTKFSRACREGSGGYVMSLACRYGGDSTHHHHHMET